MLVSYDPDSPAFLPEWRNLEPDDLAAVGFFGATDVTYWSDGVEIDEHPAAVMLRDQEVAEIVDWFFSVGCAAPSPRDLELYGSRFMDGWITANGAVTREKARREKESVEEAKRKGDRWRQK